MSIIDIIRWNSPWTSFSVSLLISSKSTHFIFWSMVPVHIAATSSMRFASLILLRMTVSCSFSAGRGAVLILRLFVFGGASSIDNEWKGQNKDLNDHDQLTMHILEMNMIPWRMTTTKNIHAQIAIVMFLSVTMRQRRWKGAQPLMTKVVVLDLDRFIYKVDTVSFSMDTYSCTVHPNRCFHSQT